jgi:broad specificity phosphatase PhoE
MNDASPIKTTQLFLIRHGATDANLRRPPILQGCGIDLSLNETGRTQAQQLAEFLSTFPISQIYSSPLRRALETAAAISQSLNLTVSLRSELMECNVGKWEGLDWGTIRRDFPDAVRQFDEDSGECPYLGGESYGDVLRRAAPVIDGLLEQHAGESVVVVAHNVVTRVYLANLLGLDLKRAKSLRQANGCVNLIQMVDGTRSLVTLNGLFHLERALWT